MRCLVTAAGSPAISKIGSKLLNTEVKNWYRIMSSRDLIPSSRHDGILKKHADVGWSVAWQRLQLVSVLGKNLPPCFLSRNSDLLSVIFFRFTAVYPEGKYLVKSGDSFVSHNGDSGVNGLVSSVGPMSGRRSTKDICGWHRSKALLSSSLN